MICNGFNKQINYSFFFFKFYNKHLKFQKVSGTLTNTIGNI